MFSTIVQRPDLVMDHVSAYVALFHEEVSDVGTDLVARAVAWVIAVLAAGVFLALAGTAVMLGMIHNQFHWALAVVPGVALVIVIAAVLRARKPFVHERFPELKAQIDNDARALRMAA
ncbi:hypothetical protein [Polaromonas sp.]|uniref:hypothetical protein n=1 Tax=Polaromonas sp. TaxID=1869339 RepID=UPI0032643507